MGPLVCFIRLFLPPYIPVAPCKLPDGRSIVRIIGCRRVTLYLPASGWHDFLSRYPWRRHVRHETGHHQEDPSRGQDRHTGRGAASAEDPANGRVRAVGRVHRRAAAPVANRRECQYILFTARSTLSGPVSTRRIVFYGCVWSASGRPSDVHN